MSGKSAKRARQNAAAIYRTMAAAQVSWQLPPGVHLREISDPAPMRGVDDMASTLIADYSSPAQMATSRDAATAVLDELFAGSGHPAPQISAIVATDETGSHLYGAASVEPFLGDELLAHDRRAALAMAAYHRVLTGLFVIPDARGQGLATALLDAAALAAARSHARYLGGFVDDRDGSAGFYRQAGAIVGGHNVPLPPRSPVNLTTTNYPGKNGHWFYIDARQRHAGAHFCPRCVQPLTFDPADGGSLRCARCDIGSP